MLVSAITFGNSVNKMNSSSDRMANYSDIEWKEITSEVDYYKKLGVVKGCTIKEIKKKWKEIALKHHPDKNPLSSKHFPEYNVAYKVLSNVDKRCLYDKHWETSLSYFVNSSTSSISASMKKKRRRDVDRTTATTATTTMDTTLPPKNNGNLYNNFFVLFRQGNKKPKKLLKGKPPLQEVSVTIGLYHNIKKCPIKVNVKSKHHKGTLDTIDDSLYISELIQETIIQDERGREQTLRTESVFILEEYHEVSQNRFTSYPFTQILSGIGSSIYERDDRYEERGDVKVSVNFSPIWDGHDDVLPSHYEKNGTWNLFPYDDDTFSIMGDKDISPALFMSVPRVQYIEMDMAKRIFVDDARNVNINHKEMKERFYSLKVNGQEALAINLYLKKKYYQTTGVTMYLNYFSDEHVLKISYSAEELRLLLNEYKYSLFGLNVCHISVKNISYTTKNDCGRTVQAPLMILVRAEL